MENSHKIAEISMYLFLQILSKYDPKLEADAIQWMEAILGEQTMKGAEGPDQVHKVLKDGSILCKYALCFIKLVIFTSSRIFVFF